MMLLEAVPNLSNLELMMLEMENETLYDLAKSAGPLEQLYLHECYDIDSDAIAYLANKCVNLRELHVMECSIDDAGVEAIARSSPHLETVELQGNLTDAAVIALVTHCGATLQNLSLQDVTLTTVASLLVIA